MSLPELHEATIGQTEDYVYSLGYMYEGTQDYNRLHKRLHLYSVTITVFAVSSTEGLTAFGLTYMRIDNLQIS